VARPRYGRGGRPLWTERDRDAENIRKVLRRDGRREWGKRFGRHRGGFVVEGDGKPFYVACAADDVLDKLDTAAEVAACTCALTRAGYRVEPRRQVPACVAPLNRTPALWRRSDAP
jgi:hypothetical protein